MQVQELNDKMKAAILKEYTNILTREPGHSFAQFCKTKHLDPENMRRWMNTYLNMSVGDIKKIALSRRVKLTEAEVSVNSNLDFIQVVPIKEEDVSQESISEDTVTCHQARTIYGVSIVCPSGMSINVQECTVDNLAFLMKSL